MEDSLVQATLFIPLAIIAVIQFVKYLAPKVNGAWTILIAFVLGGLVGLVDQLIGVTDISPALGVVLGLGAVGITTIAQKFGEPTSTPKAK